MILSYFILQKVTSFYTFNLLDVGDMDEAGAGKKSKVNWYDLITSFLLGSEQARTHLPFNQMKIKS
jgi:hypothetical protein